MVRTTKDRKQAWTRNRLSITTWPKSSSESGFLTIIGNRVRTRPTATPSRSSCVQLQPFRQTSYRRNQPVFDRVPGRLVGEPIQSVLDGLLSDIVSLAQLCECCSLFPPNGGQDPLCRDFTAGSFKLVVEFFEAEMVDWRWMSIALLMPSSIR